VGVKLDYTIETNDYLQPASLIAQIEAAVNASAKLDGYEVVGYRLKAGLQDFDFGVTYDDFGTTRGNPALAEGLYTGTIELKASEINDLKPIDLDQANPADLTPAMLSAGDPLDSPTSEKTDATTTPDDGAQSAPGEGTQAAGSDQNTIHDTSGDTLLVSTVGADVFKWSLAEPGAHDTIIDFSMNPPSSGGDVLDLRDLLPPESAGALSSYLHFEASGSGGTLLKISTSGGFTGNPNHDAHVEYQTIELANVNLLDLGPDQQIIETLISQNKLITD